MKAFEDDFETLLAVVVATLDSFGGLIEANAGFYRLLAVAGIKATDVDGQGSKVRSVFINPSFETLCSAPPNNQGIAYEGLMTLGGYDSQTRTLRGRVWRNVQGIRIVAEYDIEELERIGKSLLMLNTDSASAHLDAVRDNVRLRQREVANQEVAMTDQLTGLGNRHYLTGHFGIEISRANRIDAPLSALMADIDFFKGVNDRYGHAVGDVVLVQFATLMKNQLRPTDLITRYGGEEFLVLMPSTNLAQAVQSAERLRAAIAAKVINPLSEPVTASFGVAEWQQGEKGEDLIERADQALYRAKHDGRNRVSAYTTAP